jgi:hypothetical protein
MKLQNCTKMKRLVAIIDSYYDTISVVIHFKGYYERRN